MLFSDLKQYKSRQCRLWRETGRNTGEPPAFHFGTREYKNPGELLRLLKPFGITTVYADNNCAYKTRVTGSETVTDRRDAQKIKRKHLLLTPAVKEKSVR